MAVKPKFYLETTVIIELIEQPKEAEICRALWQILEAADERQCEVFTSALTLVEVLFAEKEKKKGEPDPNVADLINTLWHPESSPIQIVPCHEAITRESLSKYREHWGKSSWSKSKGVDLVHLVTARREKVDKFFTTEGAMSKWASVMGFKVCRPELDQRKGTVGLFNGGSSDNH